MKMPFIAKLQTATAQAMHDMQTPLLTLRMSLDALIREDHRFNFIDMAHNALDDIVDISRDLMQQCYAVPTETRLPTVQLLPLIRSLLETQRFVHREVTVLFHCDDMTDTAPVRVDRALFKRLLVNLINNAVEAIDHDKGEVTLTLRTTQENVTLTLTDNGCGMDEATLQRVLQSGDSIGKAQGDITKGKGLGLSSAGRWLVEWGGELVVRSVEAHGTTLTLSLPSALTD